MHKKFSFNESCLILHSEKFLLGASIDEHDEYFPPYNTNGLTSPLKTLIYNVKLEGVCFDTYPVYGLAN